MYKVQVTPLIGLPRFDGWAHVTTISNGRVVWALSVSGQHARNIGRDLLDMITAIDTAAGTQIDGAALYTLVTQLIQESTNKEGQLSLACGWLPDQGKSVFCCYQGSIVLKRNGKSGLLLQAGKQLKVIEGSVTPEDVYIFATAQATQFLGEVQQKLEQGYEIDTIVTSITPSLHLEETTALSAMAFVKQEQVVKMIKPEEVLVPEPEPILQQIQPHLEPKIDVAPEFVPEPGSKSQLEPELESGYQDFAVGELASPVGNIELSEPEKKVIKVDFDKLSVRAKSAGVALKQFSAQLGVQVGTQFSKLQQMVKAAQVKRQSNTVTTPSYTVPMSSPTSAPVSAPTLPAISDALPSYVANDVALPSFLQPNQTKPSFTQEVYVGTAARRQSIRTVLIIGVILAIIVGAGAYFLFQRQQQAEAAAAALQPFEQQLQQAREMVNQDPITARTNIQQAIAGIETLQVTFRDKSVGLSKIDASLAEAKKFYDEVSGREEFSELSVFFNSRNDTMDIVITHSGVFKESLVFFDAQKRQGALVKVSDKAVTPFTIELDKEVSDLAANMIDGTLWLLTDAVHQFDPSKSGAKSEEKLAVSDRLSSGRLISVFGNAVYIFNPSERTILKYTEEDDEFTGPIKWLRSAQGLDFEQVVSMVVDGDIWLSDKKGGIFRLRGGNAQDFSVKGLEQPFKSSLILYTSEESEKLYILEPDSHRIVILTKDGEFIREVTSSSLAAASHIVVNAEETKLFAVSGSTVYEVSL